MPNLDSVLPVYYYSNSDFDEPLGWASKYHQIPVIEIADIDFQFLVKFYGSNSSDNVNICIFMLHKLATEIVKFVWMQNE